MMKSYVAYEVNLLAETEISLRMSYICNLLVLLLLLLLFTQSNAKFILKRRKKKTEVGIHIRILYTNMLRCSSN